MFLPPRHPRLLSPLQGKDKALAELRDELHAAREEVVLLTIRANEDAERWARRALDREVDNGGNGDSRPHDAYSRLVQEVDVCRQKLNDCSFEELVKEEMSNAASDGQQGGSDAGLADANATIDPESILSTSDARLDVCVLEANFIADNSFSNGDHAGGDSIPATFASLLIENAKLRRSLNQMSRLAWSTTKAGTASAADTAETTNSIASTLAGVGAAAGSGGMLATAKITDAMKWLVKSKGSVSNQPAVASGDAANAAML